MSCNIHPTAIIAQGAELGEGVVIGPYCVVDSKVKIGDGSVLSPFVRILDYVTMGQGCQLHENVVLGGTPQDHDFDGSDSWVRLGDRVICRESVTIHRGSGKDSETVVGDDCMIMEGVHLGHNTRLGKKCILTNKVGLSGYVEVGDGAVLGGIAGVHQFIKIGRYAMVGGLSKVNKDVPPFCLADGFPVKVYGLNSVGLRRNGFSQADRTHIKEIYRILYRERLPLKEALARIETQWPSDVIASEIVAFIRSLKRGLAPWSTGPRSASKESGDD